ncbi:hypothetical protein NP493_162g07017 [Ridgeia piscesae]|uniref:Dedicator of cytokinesis protein 3 n=1 Tax=Ridgeia piscesae TaxID=27915 RepID=A0AAD9P420_RIDPI|nr:hypothetical protein NP493_162g07017 [Ridgeia piscesae]
MQELMAYRKQLMSGTLTRDQCHDLKAVITCRIDWGNKKLGLDLVPRIDSEQVDVDQISPVELFRIHEKSMEDSAASIRGSMRRSRTKRPDHAVIVHHLHFELKAYDCSTNGAESEVHFSLYDNKSGSYFSERFLLRMSKEGRPTNCEKQHNPCSLFTDLGNQDLLRDAYLVAHIYRLGSLRETESKKTPTTMYRRPYGCAVLSLREILQTNQEQTEEAREFHMKVYCCGETDFPQLHESLVKKQNAKFSLSSNQSSSGLMVALRLLHGDIEQARKKQPILLRGITVVQKLGFSDIIMPGDMRNDLYLTLTRGDFEKGAKTAAKNIEVRVTMFDADGNVIQNCISPGAGVANVTEYNGVIFYHNNSPRWNDTVKLTIPIEKYYRSHLRLEFRHCSTREKAEKKLFAFAFVKLVADDGTTLCDGAHELYVYKCGDGNSLKSSEKYRGLPSSPSEINPNYGGSQGNVFFHRNEKETMFIHTLLCSTKLTQNADLLAVLKWTSEPNKIGLHLQKLMNLDGEEIVKYLQDIMDALFNMFSVGEGKTPTESSHLIFKTLINIFNMLEQSKFEHFKPVMATYIDNHFSAVLVYKDLLLCLKEFLSAVPSVTDQQLFQKCFQVLDYIAKCIVQSRLLNIRATGNRNKDEFRRLLDDVFLEIRQVLSLHFDIITVSQGILLAKIPSMLSHLLKLVDGPQLSHTFCTWMNCLPRDLPDSLRPIKLQCIRDVVNSPMFSCKESRKIILPMCMAQLKRHLVVKQETILCSNILGDILVYIHSGTRLQNEPPSESDVHVILSAMLDVVIQVILTIDRILPVTGHLVAGLTAMLKLMDEEQYRLLVESYSDRRPLKDFLLHMMDLLQQLVKQSVYPCDWRAMPMVTNNMILLTSQFLSQTLSNVFLKGSDFDFELWTRYFCLCVSFLTQPALQLESFSEATRQKILDRYGDMRVLMGYEILTMWQSLGDHKIEFVPSMVGRFLEVTLVPETELRKATLPIFFDMMECEQNARGNFSVVECELIDKLDVLISENKGDDEHKQLFNTILLGKVQSHPRLHQNGKLFIQSVTRLLERLLDYRNVLDREDSQDKKMTCTFNLLNFYKKEIDRQEMYIRYIYKLHELHLASGNYTEAAFTLLLHAELLTWGDGEMPPEMNYPLEPEWQRKERLCHRILAHFDKGKSWEFGIPLCKELSQLYESKIQYSKLCEILQTQAGFYSKILENHRPEPVYFRVGYFGQGFPLFLRNKEFIHRGSELEKLGTFQHRIQAQFPEASMMGSINPPSEAIKQGLAQYIQVCTVTPLSKVASVFLRPDIPENVRSFHRVNHVDHFQLDRPFHKGVKDSNNEFKTLYLERTTIRTLAELPGILRWFEVAETHTEELSPVETAIDAMEMKNNELRQLVTQHLLNKNLTLKPLTMRLNGVLDAAVNGGISKYQDAFFSEEFALTHPQFGGHTVRLKALFLEQVQILDGMLTLHGRLVAPEMQPLHDRLVELFQTMKQGIKASGSPNMERLADVSKLLAANSSHSVSSLSSSPTPTPPGSNRSSGVFVVEPTTVPLSGGQTETTPTRETNILSGFGSLLYLARSHVKRRASSPTSRCSSASRGSNGSPRRPRSAVFASSFMSTLEKGTMTLGRRGRRDLDSPNDNRSLQTPRQSLTPAPSCVSLDGAVGTSCHRRSRTVKPPPRKLSSQISGDGSDLQLQRSTSIQKAEGWKPPLPDRKHLPKTSVSSVSPSCQKLSSQSVSPSPKGDHPLQALVPSPSPKPFSSTPPPIPPKRLSSTSVDGSGKPVGSPHGIPRVVPQRKVSEGSVDAPAVPARVARNHTFGPVSKRTAPS